MVVFFNVNGTGSELANWRPPSLSELTPMLFNTGLTHLGSEASNSISLGLLSYMLASRLYILWKYINISVFFLPREVISFSKKVI